MEKKARFFKMALLIIIALFLSHSLGKGAIDRLVDSDLKGAIMNATYMVICLIVLIILLVLDKKNWLTWTATIVLSIGFFLFGFYFWVSYNPNIGLKVSWDDSVGTKINDLDFDRTKPETGYDLYLPTNKSSDGSYALVLYIHGGGFSGGDKSDGDVWCKYMTSKGYVSATMNYTLMNDETNSNLTLMSEQVMQCVEAIQLQSQQKGYPVTEMAVTGSSAGGGISLLFSYGIGKGSPVPVKFVFQQTGPVTFDPVLWGTTNNDYVTQSISISAFTGEKITPEMVKNGDQYPYIEAISPVDLVNKDTIPTLSAYGPKDKMVPAQLKYLLFSALEKNRVPYDYVEYPNSNHGLYDDPAAQKEFLRKLDEYCSLYFSHHPI